MIMMNAVTKYSLALVILSSLLTTLSYGKTRYFDWKIEYTNVTRLCNTKSLVSVNGQFPGPTSTVREGDCVIVNVTNLVDYNVTIHWHGVRQLLSAWADGPAYITQCPIQKGHSYVHNFTIAGQRGTLFWHAHISWLRATLYGAFIIRPRKNGLYPFKNPIIKEIPLILGEWWNANPEDVVTQALNNGGGYNISNALTINGQPGVLYNCSLQGTVRHTVKANRTYLIRLINAAVNFELYFSVTNHSLTVVEADAEYTSSYTTDVVMLAPGQTTNVLLNTSQAKGQYIMAASVHSPAPINRVRFPTIPTTAILKYSGAASVNASSLPLPTFPAFNDTTYALNFLQALKSRSFSEGYYYMDVPETVDESLLYTVGYATRSCPSTATQPCPGPGGNALSAAISNVSFETPTISLIQAYYNQISNVYETSFPDYPDVQYNYTGTQPNNTLSLIATKVKVLPFNASVQIVFQDTATFFFESHPMHLHGQNFWIVGSGHGNFNPNTDPANFNLINPPSRNTVAVPSGGWAAIRWRAQNPGVWYLHCHLDIHASWGMMMAFIVQNGNRTHEILPPPPTDLPPC